MGDRLVRKGLVIVVIVLFWGIIVSPSIIADDEAKEYPQKIGEYDNYEEIITFIHGDAEINWIVRKGFFRGEANLTWDNYQIGFIYLSGFRRSDSVIEYYFKVVDFVYAYYFIGYSTDYSFPETAPPVIGIALGNIEWG